MQTRNRIFDDLSRLASGAVGTLTAVRQEIEALVRQRLDAALAEMDLVRREEFEAVRAVAVRARERQEALEARVTEMEKRLAGPSGRGGATNKAGTAKKTGQGRKSSPAAARKRKSN
ncbi:MAG: accessory factor UbiK family protein [Acetobacterales bacterium]